MKRFISLLIALILILPCAFAETDEMTAEYEDLLYTYAAAKQSQLTYTACEEAGINPMIADCDAVGYAIADLDGDGTPELIIASMSENEFFRNMVFELFTYRNEVIESVFSSAERDRYYFAGSADFVHEGSNGADDSIETTVRYENGALTDLGNASESCATELALTPLGE